jgi:uncharacterized protein (TIGR02271 family)
MSGILNKLGLGHDSTSAASSSSSSSTTSSSTQSTKSGTGMAGSTRSGNTINKTGYADTTEYAHTAGPGYGTAGSPYNAASTTTTATTTTAGNTVDPNDGYMTRSEERLLVGKEQMGAGVASLNKYVTTEHVSTAVPIVKEHVVIEREPIAPGDSIRSDIKEAHYEVALTEERAVAAKEAVAVEKVKLRKEVEHAVQNVDADLRKEHIEFGTTNETGKVLGAAPGTAGYDTTGYSKTTTTTSGSNIDPVANPRV